MRYKIYLIATLVIASLFILLINTQTVSSICCASGCFPGANCCIEDESSPLNGKGVVGCPLKNPDGSIQYVCPGEGTYLEPACGVCGCTAVGCNWETDSTVCNPDYCTIQYDGSPPAAESSVCVPRCPDGQTLCADNVCRSSCGENPPVCDGNCENGNADSCVCSECDGKQASCEEGSVCDSITKVCVSLPPCPEDTTLCADGLCRNDCSVDGGNAACNGDSVCDATEGCSCSDCDKKESPCQAGLYCSEGLCKKKPSTTCPSCSDCSVAGSTDGATCTIDECHTCDSEECYFSSGNCNDCDSTKPCSTYNNDPQACNGLISGCDKNCYYVNDIAGCDVCIGKVNKCSDYAYQQSCVSNPCSTGSGQPNSCVWFISSCIDAPAGGADASARNCELFEPSKFQGICNEKEEQYCWDDNADGAAEAMSCCGDDGYNDDWKNSDGSGCVDGKYYQNPNQHKNLCGTGLECTDKNINCWSSSVIEDVEASDLTKCCESTEQWYYVTSKDIAEILAPASCASSEWYDSSRTNSVTYYQIMRIL